MSSHYLANPSSSSINRFDFQSIADVALNSDVELNASLNSDLAGYADVETFDLGAIDCLPEIRGFASAPKMMSAHSVGELKPTTECVAGAAGQSASRTFSAPDSAVSGGKFSAIGVPVESSGYSAGMGAAGAALSGGHARSAATNSNPAAAPAAPVAQHSGLGLTGSLESGSESDLGLFMQALTGSVAYGTAGQILDSRDTLSFDGGTNSFNGHGALGQSSAGASGGPYVSHGVESGFPSEGHGPEYGPGFDPRASTFTANDSLYIVKEFGTAFSDPQNISGRKLSAGSGENSYYRNTQGSLPAGNFEGAGGPRPADSFWGRGNHSLFASTSMPLLDQPAGSAAAHGITKRGGAAGFSPSPEKLSEFSGPVAKPPSGGIVGGVSENGSGSFALSAVTNAEGQTRPASFQSTLEGRFLKA